MKEMFAQDPTMRVPLKSYRRRPRKPPIVFARSQRRRGQGVCCAEFLSALRQSLLSTQARQLCPKELTTLRVPAAEPPYRPYSIPVFATLSEMGAHSLSYLECLSKPHHYSRSSGS
eukprot:1180647-Prorocentrum_minimum.AAC.3